MLKITFDIKSYVIIRKYKETDKINILTFNKIMVRYKNFQKYEEINWKSDPYQPIDLS